jgi:hypothetical protein
MGTSIFSGWRAYVIYLEFCMEELIDVIIYSCHSELTDIDGILCVIALLLCFVAPVSTFGPQELSQFLLSL